MEQRLSSGGAARRLALVSDVFPPLRSSGAVQLRDLAREMASQGYQVTAIVAAPGLSAPWQSEVWNGVRVLRLRTPQTKDVNYVKRTLAECLMPLSMVRNLRKSPVGAETFDAVIWYSPSIFLGPVAKWLKTRNKCPSYLIIRDIFPEWAVDMGLMGRGLPYRFFKAIANYQYAVADVIGVQTPGNLGYFDAAGLKTQRVEVLHNWLAEAPKAGCSIDVDATALRGRKIFVYAGNMGIAQGMGVLLQLAERLKARHDIGFLFVGRGSDVRKLRDEAAAKRLDNVLFRDEIDPDEIPGLYAQCHIGLVALDPRHKTHNIPGKFLSYMQASLPVLASINDGNDLAALIMEKRVGGVCTDHSAESLVLLADQLLLQLEQDAELKNRCRMLAAEMFSSAAAVRQINSAIEQEYERKRIFIRATRLSGAQGSEVDPEEATPEYSSQP
jgi:glycosyltransferase involved in cell wall biosynthesis